jgi:hypothetical protein
VGARTAAAALVEEDDAEDARVEVAAHGGGAASSRTAVEDDDGNSVGATALFDIDPVAVAHIYHALIERVDRRVKVFDCALLT